MGVTQRVAATICPLALAVRAPSWYRRGTGGCVCGAGVTGEFLCMWITVACTRHPEVIVAVAVGFSKTGDGHDHRQGASFARADSYDSRASRELARPGQSSVGPHRCRRGGRADGQQIMPRCAPFCTVFNPTKEPTFSAESLSFHPRSSFSKASVPGVAFAIGAAGGRALAAGAAGAAAGPAAVFAASTDAICSPLVISGPDIRA